MDDIKHYRLLKTKEDGEIRFTVNWSPYYEMERFLIAGRIPSESGIYQVFRLNRNQLEEISTGNAYYGGLRNTFREMVDELSPRVFEGKDYFLNDPCFCRFATCSSIEDIEHVVNFINGNGSIDHLVAQNDNPGLIRSVPENIKTRASFQN